MDGMQIQRVFLLKVSFRKGQAFSFSNDEVCRLWLDSTGKNSAVTSRKRTMRSFVDTFDWSSKIELRSFSDTIEVISDNCFYPRIKLIPELKRNGMSAIFKYSHPFFLMKLILANSKIETIAKSKDMQALQYFVRHPDRIDKYWCSYKISKRQGYIPNDYGMWCDLIRMLEKLGKDIRSTKFICPADLKAEHDRLSDKIHAIEDAKRKRAELVRAKKDEEAFYKDKSPYFNIVISDDDLEITVLDSISAYFEEGSKMHHCVFSAGYYKTKDSIILSARDYDGQRLETVEFSLTQNKVVQCYGKYNKLTPMHDRIINLVNSNAYRFIKAKASA